MTIELCIAVTFLVTGMAALSSALLVADDRTAKRIVWSALAFIYAGAMVMIWGC